MPGYSQGEQNYTGGGGLNEIGYLVHLHMIGPPRETKKKNGLKFGDTQSGLSFRGDFEL